MAIKKKMLFLYLEWSIYISLSKPAVYQHPNPQKNQITNAFNHMKCYGLTLLIGLSALAQRLDTVPQQHSLAHRCTLAQKPALRACEGLLLEAFSHAACQIVCLQCSKCWWENAICPQLPYLCCAIPGPVTSYFFSQRKPKPKAARNLLIRRLQEGTRTQCTRASSCALNQRTETSQIRGNSWWARTTEELCCHGSTSVQPVAHLFLWAAFSSYNPQPQIAH